MKEVCRPDPVCLTVNDAGQAAGPPAGWNAWSVPVALLSRALHLGSLIMAMTAVCRYCSLWISLDLSLCISLALSVVCVYDNDARTQPHTARIDHAPRRAAVQSLLAAGALLG